MVFHDTNMAKRYRKKNGTMGMGWDNERGVIRAIEEYFGYCFNEQSAFVQWVRGCVVEHVPYCNGLTTLIRIDPASSW